MRANQRTIWAAAAVACMTALAGCMVHQRDEFYNNELFFSNDAQRMAVAGLRPIEPNKPDAPSTKTLDRGHWAASKGGWGVPTPSTTVLIPRLGIDHFQIYTTRPGYVRSTVRQRGEWPTLESAFDLPSDDDRGILAVEAVAWPTYGAMDIALLLPRMLMTRPCKPATTIMNPGTRPSMIPLFATPSREPVLDPEPDDPMIPTL